MSLGDKILKFYLRSSRIQKKMAQDVHICSIIIRARVTELTRNTIVGVLILSEKSLMRKDKFDMSLDQPDFSRLLSLTKLFQNW